MIKSKLGIACALALSFTLVACGGDDPQPEYRFQNLDMDSFEELAEQFGKKYNYHKGYLYNTETEEISFIAYTDLNGADRFFVKSYTSDARLKLHFEANAEDAVEAIKEKATHLVDQDGKPMTKYIFFGIYNDGRTSLSSDKVGIELNDPLGKIKCFANGGDPIEKVLRQADEETETQELKVLMLPGTCVPDKEAIQSPAPAEAPKNSMNS